MKNGNECIKEIISNESINKDIQKFVYTKVIIKSPIPKKEFLDNMNKALCDIDLESNEQNLTFQTKDSNNNNCMNYLSNAPNLNKKHINPDLFSRISSLQL